MSWRWYFDRHLRRHAFHSNRDSSVCCTSLEGALHAFLHRLLVAAVDLLAVLGSSNASAQSEARASSARCKTSRRRDPSDRQKPSPALIEKMRSASLMRRAATRSSTRRGQRRDVHAAGIHGGEDGIRPRREPCRADHRAADGGRIREPVTPGASPILDVQNTRSQFCRDAADSRRVALARDRRSGRARARRDLLQRDTRSGDAGPLHASAGSPRFDTADKHVLRKA